MVTHSTTHWRIRPLERLWPAILLCIVGAAPLASGDPGAPARKPRTHLFIVAGEANAAGLKMRGPFTKAIKTAFPGDRMLFVREADEQAPIVRWDQTWRLATRKSVDADRRGDLYARLEAQLRATLAGETVDTVTLLWLQGETDGRLGLEDAYEKALTAVVDRLRDDLKRDDMHVVMARISDHGHGRSYARSWRLVRLTQVDVAEMDPYAEWINTDDLNGDQNDLLYPADGRRELERRFAARAIKLIATTPRAP